MVTVYGLNAIVAIEKQSIAEDLFVHSEENFVNWAMIATLENAFSYPSGMS